MNYLEGLNERQREAVLATTGPVSVLAGAGSGKTRVLTTRIYHLIREGVPPEKILAVTFTNKAAREMRDRVERMLDPEGNSGQVVGGRNPTRFYSAHSPLIVTFHGLGRNLLERYGSVIGVPRYFSIFDRDDSERAIKAALKEMDIDPKEMPPRAILARISKGKSDGQTAEEFSTKHGRDGFRNRTIADVWRRYEATLKKEKALDFDDLICLPVRLLAEHDAIRARVQEEFSHIHIDEYQDTNDLQARLATLMLGETQNLFVVADGDQCIYTWRGANMENILNFERDYPGTKLIILDENYRSTATIVEAANQIISVNRNRKEKRSVTNNPDGAPITLLVADTADAEAVWVAREARKLIESGLNAEDVAVLFRTNFQSRALEEAFLTAGVPYRLLGTRFFERKEIKDVLSWIRLALEPSRESDMMRAIQSPSRGLGKVTLGKVLAGKRGELRAGEAAKMESFEALIEELGTLVETVLPSVFVREVVRRSGLESALQKGGEDDHERLENIKELATFATRYDGLAGREGVAAFLADAALASDQDEMDRKNADGGNKRGVTLMTVHAAKGLEFEAVFVTGLEEGLFPHEGMNDEKRDEEEERRLFYVAVTRAKTRLYLTLARVRRIYGSDFFSEPSSFLHDIDAGLMVTKETNRYHDDADEDIIEI